MSSEPRPSSANADERRADPRVASDGPVRVLVTTEALDGTSENLSEAGILLVTDQALRVAVEYDGPDGRERRQGRLVRVQRMGASGTGMAVEFDAD